MNKKAYKALEYYKIIDLLTDKASSPMGKDLCRKLTPSTDIDEIRSMQLQTHDALARLFKKGGISNQPVAASAMIRVFPSLEHSDGACPHSGRQFVGLSCSTYQHSRNRT